VESSFELFVNNLCFCVCFFFKCEAVSVSNKWYIVHTLQNITDSILCLVYWAGVGKNTVE